MTRPDHITLNGQTYAMNLTEYEKDIYECGELAGEAKYRDALRARIQALPGAHLSGDAKGVVYRAAVLALLNDVRP